ncbi:MAG: hypothetical protein KGR98_10585, partial [Verrucomicrobia bacterium]|nr:hypothetical protein [Verrucomicrobiota bacterium]
MSDFSYQRLTRARARGLLAIAVQSRFSLWLGPDHLLHVESSGYTESYKRFYFRDVQTLTIRETTRRNVWNAILILPVVFCLVVLVISLFPLKNIAAVITWSILATLLVVPFVINNLRGPTCACELRTAVQIEELPSLSRVRKTRRVLAKIRPLIAAAQGGELSAAAVSAQLRGWVATSAGAPSGVLAA